MYICICHGISDRHLRDALCRGVNSFEELQACTGVSTCCGACEDSARELVSEVRTTVGNSATLATVD